MNFLLGNFRPFHGSAKSKEGVGSRTMKTISSCPADSVQPPTDYSYGRNEKMDQQSAAQSNSLSIGHINHTLSAVLPLHNVTIVLIYSHI